MGKTTLKEFFVSGSGVFVCGEGGEMTCPACGKLNCKCFVHALQEIPYGDDTNKLTARAKELCVIQDTLSERGKNYGSFQGNAAISQRIKTVLEMWEGWDRLSVTQQEALHLIASKLSRILGGDPNYRDSWWGIIGYVQLVINELDGK